MKTTLQKKKSVLIFFFIIDGRPNLKLSDEKWKTVWNLARLHVTCEKSHHLLISAQVFLATTDQLSVGRARLIRRVMAKFRRNRWDMYLTYAYTCFFARLAKKNMNHKIYFSKTSKKLMSCVKFNVRTTGENDRRRCWSSVATFVYDQQSSFPDTFWQN